MENHKRLQLLIIADDNDNEKNSKRASTEKVYKSLKYLLEIVSANILPSNNVRLIFDKIGILCTRNR